MAQEQISENDLTYCEICDKLLWDNKEIDEDYHYDPTGTIIVCCSCFDTEWFDCDQCGNTFEKDEINMLEGETYCNNCYNEIKGEYGQ